MSGQGRESNLVRQRARLAAWLREWELDTRLEGAVEQEPGGDSAAGPSGAQPDTPVKRTGRRYAVRSERLRIGAGPEPLQGRIVLLPPDAAATRSRPVYVAVLEQTRPGAWWVVPFGRFTHAALPGELETGRRAVPLRVLCVWNRSVVPETRLRAGWGVGRLGARERGWVEQVMEAERSGRPGRALAARTGPPLVHPLDPRHLYLEAERALWLPDEPGLRLSESPAAYEPRGPTELPMAAEQPPEWNG